MVKLLGKLPFFSALALLLFCACASSGNISEELSPAELIQRAQEASDRNRYKVAQQYYIALLERNRDNIDLVITAEYEIAFIHYKQKKYSQARAELNAVLDYYNTPDEELLPQQFKRLSQIVIGSINEKESRGGFFSFFKKKDKTANSNKPSVDSDPPEKAPEVPAVEAPAD